MQLTPAGKKLFDSFITDTLSNIKPLNLNEYRHAIALLQNLPYLPYRLGDWKRTQARYIETQDHIAFHVMTLAIGLSSPQHINQQISIGLSEHDWYVLGQVNCPGKAGYDNYHAFKALFQDKIQSKIDHLEKMNVSMMRAAENLANAKAANYSRREKERASRHLKMQQQPGLFSKFRRIDSSSESEAELRAKASESPRLR